MDTLKGIQSEERLQHHRPFQEVQTSIFHHLSGLHRRKIRRFLEL